MPDAGRLERLDGLERLRGSRSGALTVAGRAIRFDGLDDDLFSILERRWGRFWSPCNDEPAHYRVAVMDAGTERWLEAPRRGEHYRVEARQVEGTRFVVSYFFALRATAQRGWRLGVTDQVEEPPGRLMDNVARYLTARLALDLGGFALHAAAVERDGRVFVFAGPSRSGKSTAVRLSPGAVSLGDDYALVFPRDAGWVAPATPFDNSELAPEVDPRRLYSLAGVWRLRQAAEHAVATPPRQLSVAALLGCAALPWAMPECGDALLDHVKQLVEAGLFAELSFRQDAGFWTLLLPNPPVNGC